jgi:DNA-binding SARP family transcriptional activator
MLRVHLLGDMALEAKRRRLEPPRRRSGRALLAYLALHPGLHARGDLAARLWPVAGPDRARSSLRTALASVRSALGADADAALVVTRDRIGLASGIDVDALAFRRLVSEGRLAEAVALGSDELLQGLDEEWALEARDEHSYQLIDVLLTLAGREQARGNLAGAVEHARNAVAVDGLFESSSRDLMRLLTAAGDRAAALAAYDRLRLRLERELGVPPSSVTREVAQAIRAAEPHAPANGANAEPSSLPPIPSAERLARDALVLARRNGDAAALSNALDTVHVLLAGTGDDERLALAEEMIAVGERSGQPELLIRGRIRRGVELLERGRLARVADEREALERIAAETGQRAHGWWAALWRATEAVLTGETEVAVQLARHAAEVGRPVYGEAAELEYAAQLFWIRWQDGATDELVAATAHQAQRFATVTPAWRCAQAALAALRGEGDDARALVDDLAGPRLPQLRADSAWAVGATLLAEACASTHHAGPAMTLYEALAPLADRWACGASGSLCMCPISRPLGLLAAAMGRRAESDRLLSDAAARARAAGADKLVARIEDERARAAIPGELSRPT